MTDHEQPTIWIPLWLPNGVKVNITVPLADPLNAYAYANAVVGKWQLDGGRIEQPLAEDVAGGESETIVTVMRRAKPSDGTPIIDFYTQWKPGGETAWGTYKYIHTYLNTPAEVNEFLAVSGFMSLEDIPLYDGQAPLKRTEGRKHPKETAVPTPFKLVRKQGREATGSDGKVYRPWEIVRYEAMTSAEAINSVLDNAPPLSGVDVTWTKADVNALLKWAQEEYKFDQRTVMVALDVKERFSEWTHGAEPAKAKIQLYAVNNTPF